jgi:putative flippase GtrA
VPTSRARALFARLAPLIPEMAKFGAVGAANVVVDVAIFNVLLFAVLPHKPLTDKGISTSVAIVSSYFMNRHWTWKDRERHGLARELPLFFLFSAIGLVIAEACLAFSHYAVGLDSKLADNISANVFGLALGMVFRFWAYRRWVFTAATSEAADAAAETTARTAV